ncbi:MAG TPA: macro domain-containing protein, partial [Anaerolineae bacterium]|nr:macro domain-containing protein [Anaerolineae bacterium]
MSGNRLQKLILVDPNGALCVAWREAFAAWAEVEVVSGYFEHLEAYDCLVSAANSFGLMDGGVDLAIKRYFGAELEVRVQTYILEHYLGEQPVGTSFIIGTGHERYPFVAHTPTMRVPMTIGRTDYVYVAMWAMLLAVRQHNLGGGRPIEVVACPGLGTATGGMEVTEAARQMSLAYGHFRRPPTYIDWRYADRRQGVVG